LLLMVDTRCRRQLWQMVVIPYLRQ